MANDTHRAEKKTPRLEDLAERAGVSISTISRALNDSPAINRRTKQRIWELARELDYPFRQRMPAGPIGADTTIAVVVSEPQARDGRVDDPFFFALLAGVADAARDRNCDVLMSHITPTSFEDLAFAMSTSRADGVIFFGQSSLHRDFNKLAQKDSRFVVWGAELPDQVYCSIGSDNELGGRRATSHLTRLGREKILFLGHTEAPETMQRYRGWTSALDAAGIEARPDWHLPVHFEVESAEAAVNNLIERGVAFDGIVAASDLIAFGAVRALQANGRRVPDDVAVIGYDNIPFCTLSRPALSTISQDTLKAGRLLVSKLIDSNGGSRRSERSPTELIIRESCGA